MKVYILMYHDYTRDRLWGVYATKELREREAKRVSDNWERAVDKRGRMNPGDLFGLDEEEVVTE